ncbi:Sec-independent protein translocase subunit TatA [Streptomyces sp. NPDC007095]|jgi:sec-independent protein translocase protein TatA|uniref:Sec-independent protein translocase subunit TatA n=1 Tax=Streptomyces sp. NPDC007095 TaxID=3154482 RepID=UPI000C7047D2
MLRNGLEPWHLLIVAIVIIVLFGSKKLPDTARALGKSMRILKSETNAMKHDGTAPSGGSSTTPRSENAPEAESGSVSAAPAPHVVQSAPGETASARPVDGGTATR